MKSDMDSRDVLNRPQSSARSEEARADSARQSATQSHPAQPQPLPGTAQQAGPWSSAAQASGRQQARKERGKPFLVAIGALLTSCLGFSVITGVIVLGAITLTVSSCVSSCSDNPIGDSRQDAAFIAALETNGRDLQTIDTLSGCLGELYLDESRDGESERTLTVAEIREAVEAGYWPKSLKGYSAIDGAKNPQAWVRLAELAAVYLEKETGETWQVDDFAYPFPNNGPIPAPAYRGEDTCVLTRVVCTSGDDEGLFVTVRYYRWRSPATYESNLEEARAERESNIALTGDLMHSEWLAGRDILFDGSSLYVWPDGRNDPLCEPDAFVEMAGGVSELTGKYLRITMVEPDMPVVVCRESLSSSYPNAADAQEMSLEQGRQLICAAWDARSLDYAWGDVLLSVYVNNGEPCTVDDLSGTLAPAGQYEYVCPWSAPDEDSAWSGGLCELVADAYGCDESQVIAVVSSSTSYGNDVVNAWVVLPRGVVSETPDEFCAEVNGLCERVWGQVVPEADEDAMQYLYLRIYMIDEGSVTDGSGSALSFEQLRQKAQERPSDLSDCSFDLLLCTMSSATRWDADSEVSYHEVKREDVGGAIARSREWHFAS